MPGEDILLTLGIDLTNIDQVASQINSRLQSQTGIGTQVQQQKELLALNQQEISTVQNLNAAIQSADKIQKEHIKTTEVITKAKYAHVQVEESLGSQIAMVTKRAILWGTVWSLVYGAIRSVQNIAQDAIKTFIDLDTQLTSLSIVSNVTRSQFGELRTEFFDLAKSMGANVTDVAGAVQIFAQQGMSISDSMELARISMIGANITGIATQEIAENLTAAFRAFNIPVNESITILDKLVAVANKTAVEMPELAGAIQRVGSTSEAVGISMDELLGYVAAIGEVTRRSGAEIGRALRTIFIRTLSDTNDELLMSAARITIYANTAKTQFKPLGDILSELSIKWNGLNDVQRKIISEALAGQRQYDMFTALMENFDRALFATKASANSAGDAMEAMRKKSESLEFQINTLKTSFKELFVEGIGNGEETFRNLITGANNFIVSLKWINDTINQDPALKALFGITTTPTIAPSTAGTVSGAMASGGLATILAGVGLKAIPVAGAIGSVGVALGSAVGVKSLFDFYNVLFALNKDLEVELQATIGLAAQQKEFLKKDREAREALLKPTEPIFATFPMSADDTQRISEFSQEIKDLTKNQNTNLAVVDLLQQGYSSLGMFFDSNKEKLGAYQKSISSLAEKLAEIDILIVTNRENLDKQTKVFQETKTPEESLKIYGTAVELQESLNTLLKLRELIQNKINELLGLEKQTSEEILQKDLQKLNNEHQLNMLRIGGASDYQLALARIEMINDGRIQSENKILDIHKEQINAVEALAKEYADIENQIRQTLESGFVDILTGKSSPKEILQQLGENYLSLFAENLFRAGGPFSGIISSLAEAGMEIKDPMQAAIIKGSETGAGYFYNAIVSAGRTITGQAGGLGAFPSFGGFGIPIVGADTDNIGTGATSSITWIGGKAYPTSSLFGGLLSGGLMGMSIGGGGIGSFLGGAGGFGLSSLLSLGAFWNPILAMGGGLLGGLFGGGSSSVSPEQTPAPTPESLGYADFGNFTYPRTYALPESAYFGGREGTTRPIVDNSISIDLSGAEIVGLDSTDVAEKIVDTIDKKLSTKYYRQVNERGLMNTYPR